MIRTERTKYVALGASAKVKTGKGRVKGIFVSSGTTVTAKLWDNTAGSGTVILETVELPVGFYELPDVEFSTGLYITVTGTTPKLSVFYN